MAKSTEQAPRRARIVLDGLPQGGERPRLVIHALDDTGQVIRSVPVEDDGTFPVDEALLSERAARIIIGPADAKPDERRKFFALPGGQFRETIQIDPDLAIAAQIWQRWHLFRRCVGGSVRRCFPFLHVIDDILVTRNLAVLPEVRKLVDFRPLTRYPFFRCSPVCFGTVEVYRRICCCRPPIIIDPDDLPIEVNPDFPFPPEDPFGPIGPRPGPDPAPFELQQLVLTGGAIDEGKIARLQARALPKNLSVDLRREFLLRYPFWWCHCGPPKKVGQGFVQDGGSFSVCWKEPPTILLLHCREEFAYVVKQPIGGVLVTIYNGLAANQWFSASDQPTLTSYDHRAIGCRDSDVPGEGAFVVLEDIGTTPSHLLATPSQTSFQSVAVPAYNSGLLNPVANPADAVGQLLNRNLGGGVALQYHFTETMRPVGAIYYRIQVAKADASGNPVGTWTVLAPVTWSTWKLNTATPGSIPLGPNPAVDPTLSKIPYDTGDPLGPNEEWQDGQYHGIIPTTDLDNDRYLVMIEVFNAAGARLKPNTAPAAEAGTPAAFTFRRWNVPASTVAVPFAALTHMMWWDNRKAVADIIDIRLNGTPSSEQCQFLESGAGATVEIGYRAYHPQPGTPSFLHTHSLIITRGLNGPSWQVANPPEAEVGEGLAGLPPPPPPPHTSVPKTLADLLDTHQKCAFAVNLQSNVKTTDGASTLTNLDAGETAAFAAEIV
jgi:hypothetical protein